MTVNVVCFPAQAQCFTVRCVLLRNKCNVMVWDALLLFCRWWRTVTSSSPNASWSRCSRRLITAESSTTLEEWWVSTRPWCAPSRSHDSANTVTWLHQHGHMTPLTRSHDSTNTITWLHLHGHMTPPPRSHDSTSTVTWLHQHGHMTPLTRSHDYTVTWLH